MAILMNLRFWESNILINYDIDYANVKDNILPAGDDLRQDAYYQVWTALYRWQSKLNNA